MWNSIIGQERVKNVLRQALTARKLPNAYLFSGPEGVGKDAVALELAKAVNCTDPVAGGTESCGVCDSCKRISDLSSSLVVFLCALANESSMKEKDKDEMNEALREELAEKSSDPYHNIHIAKAIAINVDQIRDLRVRLAQSVTGGRKRVVIVSEADMMNQQAQNAFLKTLEEPHENTLIILTSSNPARLLPTIHSRTQELRFDMLSPEEIASALEERDSLPREQAEFLARLAGGSYSAARSFSDEDIAALRAKVIDIMLAGVTKNRQGVMAQIDSLIPRAGGGSFLEKRQSVEQFLHLLSLWLRDALAICSGSTGSVYNIDQIERLEKFAAKFATPQKLIAAMRAVDIAKRNTRLQLQLRPVLLTMMMDIEEALA
jgi:DNA polymerase III subunit delta'